MTSERHVPTATPAPIDAASDAPYHEAEQAALRHLAARSGDIALATDATGRAVYVSPNIKAFGWDPTELRGSSGAGVLHPQDLTKMLAARDAAIHRLQAAGTYPGVDTSSEPVEVSYRISDHRGGWRTMRSRISGWRYAPDKIGTVASISDTTELVTATSKLDEAVKLTELIGDAASDLIAISDSNGTLLYLSASVGELLGHQNQDWIGKPISGLLHPEELPALQRQQNAHPERIAGRARVRHADGRWVWLEFSAHQVGDLTDPNDSGVMVTIARDITAQLDQERYASTLAAINEQLLLGDVETAIPYALSQLGHFVGADRVSLFDVGDTRLPLIREWTASAADPAGSRRSSIGISAALRSRWTTPAQATDVLVIDASTDQADRDVHLDVADDSAAAARHMHRTVTFPPVGSRSGIHCSLVSTHGPVAVLLVESAHDLTWRKVDVDLAHAVSQSMSAVLARVNVDRRLQRALVEAREASEAKTRFLAQVSHELRTPMHAVLGFAELLNEEELTRDGHEYVRQITNAGQHLLTLIGEILDVTRAENGEVSLDMIGTSVAVEATAVYEMLSPVAADHDVTLFLPEVDHEANALVCADPDRLRQIMINLTNNAIKYNRPGGEVHLNWTVEADNVSISVRDTGAGIPADKIGQLFRPFERLDAEVSSEGLGLGLALSQMLAKAMNGYIDVASEPGTGSTFTVVLQRMRPDQTNDDASNPDQQPSGHDRLAG